MENVILDRHFVSGSLYEVGHHSFGVKSRFDILFCHNVNLNLGLIQKFAGEAKLAVWLKEGKKVIGCMKALVVNGQMEFSSNRCDVMKMGRENKVRQYITNPRRSKGDLECIFQISEGGEIEIWELAFIDYSIELTSIEIVFDPLELIVRPGQENCQ